MRSLSSFKHELLANFAGTGWSALMQLICIPFYIKFMGIESYGLIGFYVTLQAMLQVLDLGLSPTVNREMARYSVQPAKGDEARDLVRTLEVGYWLIGVVAGAAILAASPWVAMHWIKASATSIQTIRRAVVLMGVLVVFQWPVSFYQGGLMGLRRQGLFNFLKIVVATLSSGGGVLILWRVSPTITAFLLWQVAVSLVQAVSIALFLWSSLPRSQRAPRFEPALVRKVWRFAAGMSGITAVSLILTQVDKVLVSKLLNLKVFGYYTLAWAVAGSLLVVSGAVFNVIFPRMSAQVASGDESGIRQSYHRGSQVMAVMVLPAAAVLALFPFEILQLWTQSSETAAFASPMLWILSIGSALNALLFLPYALQLAFGWTRLTLAGSAVSTVLVVVAIFPMTKYFGAVGAAAVWAVLNLMNMIIVVPIMHRRILRHELWGYFSDIGFPLLAAVGIAIIGRSLFPRLSSPIAVLAAVLSVWLVAMFAAALTAPHIRSWLFNQANNVKLQTVGE